jgi:hypothetical protein
MPVGRFSNFSLMSKPVPGVHPGGRPTFLCEQESRQRNRPGETAHPLGGFPALLEQRGPRPTRAATLCSNSDAESVLEARCARASLFCAARRFLRGSSPTAATANSHTRQPAVAGCSFTPPLAPPRSGRLQARVRSTLQELTRDACLNAVSKANEASLARGLKSEHRRAPRSAAQGRGGRGRLFAYFLVAQKVGRPPGRIPGMGLGTNPLVRAKRNQP